MKLIFFHMNQLGDLLFSLPALSSARKEWPDAKIYCVVRPEHVPLIEAGGYANVVLPRERDNIMGKLFNAVDLRKERIDKGIFFSESPETLMMGYAAGIKERIGFSSASLSSLLTEKVERSGVPSLANNKNLGLKAGLKNIPVDYTGLVKVPQSVSEGTSLWLQVNGINPEKLVVIAPGASKKRKIKYWQAERWRILAKNIIDKGSRPVFCGAPGEKDELDRLAAGFSGRARVFDSTKGILHMAALIQKAKLFVGIDSGAMHLAASLGTKVVALFGQTDPSQVGPMPLENNIVIKKDSMDDISTEEVWKIVSEIVA